MGQKMFTNYKNDLIKEFKNYNGGKFKKDLMAGITVTAVALPLALAFGVSCGASAGAGIITAIISGLVIGALSGGSFQISGPTGAMSAILILLGQQYGLEGIWVASLIAGLILIVAGVFKLGKVVSYIPLPVITGFTSGIALTIAIGQLDNFLGVTTKTSDSAIIKVFNFVRGPINPNMYAILIGLLVVAIMILWPKKWNAKVPSSLIGLIVALIVNMLFNLPVDVIGDIPQKLILDDRLTFAGINLESIKGLVVPAISIAALAMIESLLCGEVGKKMKGESFDPNRELVAQGIGNMIIPFFGGVPATAAIARTSVAIKSGAQTRLVSIFHSIFLLISMFVLAPIMSKIPLSALAGVLMVTAWRMNEWENIKFFITMMATIVFDLTQAILIGVIFASLLFMVKISNADIFISDVDENKLNRNISKNNTLGKTKVIYFTGPLFFGTVDKLRSEIESLEDAKVLILSMRGVPLIDITGIQALEEIMEELISNDCRLLLCGLQEGVKDTIEKSGFKDKIGEDKIFWSAVEAINYAEDSRAVI